MIEDILKQRRRSGDFDFDDDLRKNQENFVYKIICKGCQMALRPELRKKNVANDPVRIMGTMESEQGMMQLWMIKKIKEEKKEIINYKLDLVIENDGGELKLEKGNQKINQRFEVEKVRDSKMKYNYVRFKDSNNMYLTLDGILEMAKLNEQDENQIFLLKIVNLSLYEEMHNTLNIKDCETRKCLDVEGASFDIGALVLLWTFNNRANQRWAFDPPFDEDSPEDTKYCIINVLTKRRLWCNKNGELIQSDNDEKVWQVQKRHGISGELFCLINKKYLNRIENDQMAFHTHSNGTKWEFS